MSDKTFVCDLCNHGFTVEDCEVKDGRLVHKCAKTYEVICEDPGRSAAKDVRRCFSATGMEDAVLQFAKTYLPSIKCNEDRLILKARPLDLYEEASWCEYVVLGTVTSIYRIESVRIIED